jgi:hypothetical protein
MFIYRINGKWMVAKEQPRMLPACKDGAGRAYPEKLVVDNYGFEIIRGKCPRVLECPPEYSLRLDEFQAKILAHKEAIRKIHKQISELADEASPRGLPVKVSQFTEKTNMYTHTPAE